LRKLVVTLALIAASFALVTLTAEAAKTSEKVNRAASGNAADRGKRPPCEKRVDGVLRSIGTIGGNAGRRNVSCGKAKRVMKRYILRKKLPGDWECTNLRSFGKCADAGLPYSYGGNLNQQPFFNYEPGQRA
jgi:hypothetical protein